MAVAPPPRRSRALPIGLGLAIVLTAVAQALAFVAIEPPPSGPVLLRVRVQEGDTFAYRMETGMQGRVSAGLFAQPLDVRMTLLQDWRVEDVDDDDVATFALDTRVQDVLGGDGAVPPGQLAPAEGTARIRIAPDGNIVEAELPPAGGLTGPAGGGLTGPATLPGLEGLGGVLPEHRVEPGDTWDASYDVPLTDDASIHVTTSSAFEGYERVGDVQAAVIRSEGEMPLDFEVGLGDLGDLGGVAVPDAALAGKIRYQGAATMEARQWIDLATGLPLRSDGRVEMKMSFTISGVPESELGGPPPTTNIELDIEMLIERR